MDFEAAWERKGLQIEASLDEAVAVTADRELLSLVWNNLISNAVKFTGPGGHIRVDLEEEGIGAVVTVSDTGCGISPEVGPHIFEKFYQGDSHTAQGNGLGPALVKRERLCRLLRLFRPALPLLCLSIVLCASALVLLFKWGLEDSAVSLPGLCDRPLSGGRLVHLPPRAVRRLRAAMFASFSGGGDIPAPYERRNRRRRVPADSLYGGGHCGVGRTGRPVHGGRTGSSARDRQGVITYG